ncbi:AEC family transporter [uncultured Ilyobacter sp.]|uniref:AEC family transporter n=1 Tax=uncultured Ilyobacter sp. TaxID=544433 RepID=UPI0029BFB440|nr:AEC family transporter [uncultured Ilyobacter sp.]
MERIINSVTLIMFLMGTGCFFARKNILGEHSNKLFSYLVLNLCLPCLIILGLTSRFTREGLMQSTEWLGLSFVILLALILAAKIFSFSSFIKRKELFQLSFVFANTVFIGLPVNIALFGDDSIPYIFLFYFANTSFFWTYGVYCVRGGGSIKDGFKKLMTPATISFFVGIIMILLDLKVPQFLATYMKYLGGMTTPLAMLYLGTAIYSLGIKSLKPDFEGLLDLISKFIIAPIIALVLIKIADGFLTLPVLLKKVYFMQTTMPIMTNVAILSGYYNKNPEDASKVVGLSTILVVVTIPVYAFLAEILF